jgi:formylglycine-generating enzyme required for sulfatase activity
MNPYMRAEKNYGGNDIVVATCTADQGTAKVGSYLPNQYGLYDMYGNVREWCLDWSEREGESDNSEQIDPVGTNDGLMGSNNKRIRIYRGGGYSDGKANCNSTYRNRVASNTTWSQCGFRLAIPLYR